MASLTSQCSTSPPMKGRGRECRNCSVIAIGAPLKIAGQLAPSLGHRHEVEGLALLGRRSSANSPSSWHASSLEQLAPLIREPPVEPNSVVSPKIRGKAGTHSLVGESQEE